MTMWLENVLDLPQEYLDIIFTWYNDRGPIRSGLIVFSTGIICLVIANVASYLVRRKIALSKRTKRRQRCKQSLENLSESVVSGKTSGPLVSGAVVLSTGVVGTAIRAYLNKRRLASKRSKRRQHCKRSLEQLEEEILSGKLSAEERTDITKLSITDLVTQLQKDDSLSPSQVIEAFQAKALEVNKEINAIIEPIKEAKAQAEALDNGQQKGLLYGVPVSIKDNFGIAGYDGDVGIAKFVDKPYPDDAVIVKVLKSQGAIPFVKTNVPQTMISFETMNPIHGATVNPHDTTRGVGGSSGGEAALIAAGGSLLGFGSDIGGSIRIPAHMCGVCGLKPTAHRLSPKGTSPIMKGQQCVQAGYGPLSRDVDGLILAMKALLVPKMYELDPTIPYLPFRDEVLTAKKPLKIGYFTSDAYFNPPPAIQRGVMEAKTVLEAQGHQVVEWKYPNLIGPATSIWGKAIFGDGGEELMSLLAGDSVDDSFISAWLLLLMPNSVKTFLSCLLKPIFPKLAAMVSNLRGVGSVTNWWTLVKNTDEYRDAVITDWREKGFDAVICPGLGSTALPLGMSRLAQGVTCYTMLYNVLNFPAGSVPVTTVTKADEDGLKDYRTPDPWHMVVKKGSQGTEGLPVNVQVAALPWQEEVILRIMKELETGVKK